ncbi:hypothetical protein HNR60_004686 [Rhodopseudomonas rhenobacensis]|uniref:Uncharacterized protein n=1 Tax=Rhodopseudomonas rhenobacensis TaxID=87461 RepID=A0A7W7Z8C5_9BRAD|nr:hypothetical protein [Rhodopseudomonas rhenobacensis]MBB5049901.1 hypothetical protein [Rhodopseudomonas rhenobacensis]
MSELKRDRDRFVRRTSTSISGTAAAKPRVEAKPRAENELNGAETALLDAELIDHDQLPAAGPDEAGETSERAQIARRVIAFRDHQIRLQQEREAYYDAVLAKTRAALRSDTGRI